jgi:hypothetical protein
MYTYVIHSYIHRIKVVKIYDYSISFLCDESPIYLHRWKQFLLHPLKAWKGLNDVPIQHFIGTARLRKCVLNVQITQRWAMRPKLGWVLTVTAGIARRNATKIGITTNCDARHCATQCDQNCSSVLTVTPGIARSNVTKIGISTNCDARHCATQCDQNLSSVLTVTPGIALRRATTISLFV